VLQKSGNSVIGNERERRRNRYISYSEVRMEVSGNGNGQVKELKQRTKPEKKRSEEPIIISKTAE
jgi:hypothetical protein